MSISIPVGVTCQTRVQHGPSNGTKPQESEVDHATRHRYVQDFRALLNAPPKKLYLDQIGDNEKHHGHLFSGPPEIVERCLSMSRDAHRASAGDC